MKQIIKKKLLSSSLGTSLFYKIRVLREKTALAMADDYTYVKREFKKRYGREINLKNPQTISEKLQWLKLFYRDDDIPVCSDKLKLREYLARYGYEGLANDVLAVYENDEEIDKMDFSELPKSFVVKATHGSGWNLIVKNKDEIDWTKWKGIFKQWLGLDLSVFGREWNYRFVKPRIIVEKFLEFDPLIDYKFHCFNGEPKLIQINTEVDGISYVNFYNMNWEDMEVTYDQYNLGKVAIEKPQKFLEMINISRELSENLPFVRVDFYNYQERIFIGELTFFPGSGLKPFVPKGHDYENIVGSFLSLPDPNYNLDLYYKIQKRSK